MLNTQADVYTQAWIIIHVWSVCRCHTKTVSVRRLSDRSGWENVSVGITVEDKSVFLSSEGRTYVCTRVNITESAHVLLVISKVVLMNAMSPVIRNKIHLKVCYFLATARSSYTTAICQQLQFYFRFLYIFFFNRMTCHIFFYPFIFTDNVVKCCYSSYKQLTDSSLKVKK